MWISIGICCSAFSANPSTPSPQNWKQFYDAGKKFWYKKEYKESYQNLVSADEATRGFTGSEAWKRVEVLRTESQLLFYFKHYSQAAALLEEAAQLWQENEKSKQDELARIQYALSETFYRDHELEKAERAALASIANLEKKQGTSRWEKAFSQKLLAQIYSMQKRYPEAEALFKEAIAALETPELVANYDSYGIAEFSSYAVPSEAISHLQNDLGLLYVRTKRYQEATDQFRSALKVADAQYGKSSWNSVITMGNLLTTELHSGNFDRKQKYTDRLLKILKSDSKWEIPTIREAAVQLAAHAYKSKNEKDFEQIQNLIFSREKDHPEKEGLLSDAVSLAIVAEKDRGDWPAVEKIGRDWLARLEKQYGTNSKLIVPALEQIQLACEKQNKKEEASQIYGRAMILRRS